jgi:hypothetical protein
MNREPLPILRCESRRRHPFERGVLKWSLALMLVAAAMGDGLWLEPRAERAAARARVQERVERPRGELERREQARRERVGKQVLIECVGGRCTITQLELPALPAR